METKVKKLVLSQETLRNLTRDVQRRKDDYISQTCTHTFSCPTECACPPPRA